VGTGGQEDGGVAGVAILEHEQEPVGVLRDLDLQRGVADDVEDGFGTAAAAGELIAKRLKAP
jgi:hypothetical protein